MKKTFYEKVGKRYQPVREFDSDFLGSFVEGAHLVICKPGSTLYEYVVDPSFVQLHAAGKYAQDQMANALVEGQQKYKPVPTPITARQKELWEELKASFAEQDFCINYPSAHDAVQVGLKALEAEVEKMMTVQSVKMAYDHFMMVWKLTKDGNN